MLLENRVLNTPLFSGIKVDPGYPGSELQPVDPARKQMLQSKVIISTECLIIFDQIPVVYVKVYRGRKKKWTF